jgi:hypothetical protein
VAGAVGAPRSRLSSSTIRGGLVAIGGGAPGLVGTVGGAAAVVVGAPKSKTSSSTTIGGLATAGGPLPGLLGGVAAAAGVVVGGAKSMAPSSTVNGSLTDGIAGGAPGLVGTAGGAANGVVGSWAPASSPKLSDAVISTTTDCVGLVTGIGGGLCGSAGGVSLSAISSRLPNGPIPGLSDKGSPFLLRHGQTQTSKNRLDPQHCYREQHPPASNHAAALHTSIRAWQRRRARSSKNLSIRFRDVVTAMMPWPWRLAVGCCTQ